MSLLSLSLLEFEDYCHLKELFWKTTVTVIVNFRDSVLELEDYCHLQELFLKTLSLSTLSLLELEDYCHLQELFWKATVTIIIVIIRIVRLLLFTRTLLEDHFHCHC